MNNDKTIDPEHLSIDQPAEADPYSKIAHIGAGEPEIKGKEDQRTFTLREALEIRADSISSGKKYKHMTSEEYFKEKFNIDITTIKQ